MKDIIKASFFQKIVLPALLAILLFIISIYIFIIPAFENNAIAEKKTMLNELTNTAWSILNKYYKDEKKGLISHEEAQEKAKFEIEALRYGFDKKDYFWITDFKPTMIMHPYVHELNDRDLQNYADPDGKKIFIEALKIAQNQGEGFISYKWQLKDDSTHIVPKLSFVKKFAPWKWIIGTGIYLQDIEIQTSSLINKLFIILLAITVFISLIIFFITFQSLKIENKRRKAEEQLHESREKYKSLIESSTEGIILILNNCISYSNSFIQNWLQYTSNELLNLNIDTIISSDYQIDINNIENDIRNEIKLIKKDGLKSDAILTTLKIKFADKEGVLLTFRDISEHQTIKTELEELKNTLKTISHIATIGVFKFPINGKNRIIDFNSEILSILGYNTKEELKNVSLRQIVNNTTELKELLNELNYKKIIDNKIIKLKRKDESIIESRIYLSISNNEDYNYCLGYIMPVDKQVSNNNDTNFALQLSPLFANNQLTVSELMSTVIQCPAEENIGNCLEIMSRNNSSFSLVMLNKTCIGILTYEEIVKNYLNNQISYDSKVTEIMRAPVIYIKKDIAISEAVIQMEVLQTSFLAIKESSEEIIGVLEKNKLIGSYINIELLINRLINKNNGLLGLTNLRKEIPGIIKPLFNQFGNSHTYSKIISTFNDQITINIIENVMKELGKPPVNFAFISIGSAGREELTFNSDQDNAIIYENNSEISPEVIQDYFGMLSSRICKDLDKSGLQLCKGGYMASNPKWCQPISVWKKYFNEWIVNAEPVNIMNISVFFDLRYIVGEKKLFQELEDYIFDVLQGRTAFFYFLAQTSIGFKPPINVFGNIVTDSSTKKSDSIDIKNCLTTVIMFARIWALNNNIRHKGTLNRIYALKRIGILSQNTCEEVIFHYNYLMHLRLKQQLDEITNKLEITNFVHLKKMTEMEQMILKKIFSQMSSYEEKISATFMSGYKG